MLDPSVIYIPCPYICKGIVQWKIKNTETYQLQIYQSPIGEFSGTVIGTASYQPGLVDNYKQGDHVKVLIFFTFGGSKNEYMDIKHDKGIHILGLFNERSILNLKVENPLSESSPERLTFVNKKGSGIVASDGGETKVVSGPIYLSMKAEGFGVNKHANRIVAQNFWNVVSHNPPFNYAREHMGMYSGVDENDESTKTNDTDYNVLYRRFITQTRSIDKWVSTCEGTFAPWVGANADCENIDIGKEVLLTKIVNNGNSRVTIEYGEPGDSFINIRLDDVITSERAISTGSPGATPASLGNRFNLQVSDKGAVNLSAAGSGTPSSNPVKFSLKISENGDLTVYASGKITLSHSENDVNNNSIVIDPNAGIDIKSKKGLRFNSVPLVTKKFLEWMDSYKTMLCQVTSIGGPAPIHPTALAPFTSGLNQMSEQGGFSTTNEGVAKAGTILLSDDFVSV